MQAPERRNDFVLDRLAARCRKPLAIGRGDIGRKFQERLVFRIAYRIGIELRGELTGDACDRNLGRHPASFIPDSMREMS